MERSMEFRSHQDHHDSMSFNQAPPSMRTSAFSKPTLSPSSSLLLSSRGILASSGSRNGNCFDLPSSSPSPPPPPAPAPVTAPTPPAIAMNNPPSNPITSPIPSPSSKTPTTPPASSSSSSVKYRECLRNHAASLGGHVVDGCGEFMPCDADAIKCAACGCHRSFHRKESDGGGGGTGSDSYYRFSNGGVRRRGGSSSRMPLLLPPPPPIINPHLVPGSSATESSSDELNAPHQHPSAVAKKRFRTKFTAEQKEKMLAFSERVGWRIQRQDESMVEQFCAETGVKRQVLKVWMHNNKNTIRKQLHLQPQQQQQQEQQQPPPHDQQTQQQQQQQQQQ